MFPFTESWNHLCQGHWWSPCCWIQWSVLSSSWWPISSLWHTWPLFNPRNAFSFGFCDTGLFLLFSCLTGFFVLISLGVLLLPTYWNVLDFCLPPLLVPSYTHSLSALIQPYGFKYLYSDACKKLYFSSSLSSELFCSIACRISNRHLKLNLAQTEVLIYPSYFFHVVPLSNTTFHSIT